MQIVSSSDDVARVHEDIHLLNTIASDPTEIFFRGFAKKGYTSLFLRQKGAQLKNISTIYNKRSMISYYSPFWRKNTTGEYPPVSIQLDKYPLFAVEITPFWRKHEIISRAK